MVHNSVSASRCPSGCFRLNLWETMCEHSHMHIHVCMIMSKNESIWGSKVEEKRMRECERRERSLSGSPPTVSSITIQLLHHRTLTWISHSHTQWIPSPGSQTTLLPRALSSAPIISLPVTLSDQEVYLSIWAPLHMPPNCVYNYTPKLFPPTAFVFSPAPCHHSAAEM